MKIVLIVSLCLLFGASIFAQQPKIEAITLLRDAKGAAEKEEVESFLTTDKPLRFRIELDSVAAATIKMVIVAVEVKTAKPETKSVTVSYRTNGEQNVVNFNASPDKIWLAGKYRADIYVDNNLADSREFEIKSPAGAVVKENTPKKPRTVRKKLN